ncbi:MAG TPA: GNAT family N-acetyltransferase [Gammaproteobacteria bacterium]|nr:GNAT family N-acetyltransferase [Gammaproteobacteria bacterium]
MKGPRAYRIVDADWSRDREGIRAVRHAVFVVEQGIPESLEWDGRDAACHHVLALADVDGIVATGRLLADGRIGRMAVLQEWRGCGVGRELLGHLQRQASADGLARVYVHAQVEVADFYRRAGFQATGEPYIVAGIPHVEMHKALQAC